MKNNLKTAIIGAGISGLYLGWKLSEKGHNVTIFEKKNEIGNRVCSGLFSQRILEFIPQSQELIQNKINSAILYFPKKTIKINFSKKFFVMSHFELDRIVARLAEKSGARILLNQNISSFPPDFDKIIGCDGANSFVRKNLNLPDPNFRLGIRGFIKKPSYLDFVEIWPCQNGFTLHHFLKNGEGFIWKIPRGNEIEYGIIANPQLAKRIFDNFLKKNKISLENISSKIIPQGFIIPSHSSITLCGDAVGLTKPWSGGGVIWSLVAAEILLKSFPDFSRYKKEIQNNFLPKIILSKIATKLVYFIGFNMPWLLPKNVKIESDFLF